MEAGNPLVAVEPIDQVAKERKIVIVVAPEMGVGMAANRCAVLATGIAARHPEIKSLNEVTTALLERALQIDPNFAAVYAELAHEYRDRAF